jgi:hypothetical protein
LKSDENDFSQMARNRTRLRFSVRLKRLRDISILSRPLAQTFLHSQDPISAWENSALSGLRLFRDTTNGVFAQLCRRANRPYSSVMDAPNPSAIPTAASRAPVHIGAVGMRVRDLKIKLTEPSELDTLLDREAYLAYVREQG